MRQNIWITGASAGLGEGMAREFAARGHNLALAARRIDRLEALRDELVAANPRIEVSCHELDVNDHDRVFEEFTAATTTLGGIDRAIVNAGLGKGARIGSGRFDANRDTAMTNFVGALAQCEAAMAHFYERESGHLVLVSSMSAMRGMPSSMTTYAATKAGLAMLGEGIRTDLMRRPGLDISVTTLYPGYIASEMNERAAESGAGGTKMMVDTETGCRAMVAAIEKEVTQAEVPGWPWKPIGFVMRHAPLSIVRRMV
ncbi:SDR family oxidoreductase [Nocardioidaceae bacterium SCSIO 66511]|nr:SDR family oxidoreductase [Nocardioidaceae bacterium SCSIO 66511]